MSTQDELQVMDDSFIQAVNKQLMVTTISLVELQAMIGPTLFASPENVMLQFMQFSKTFKSPWVMDFHCMKDLGVHCRNLLHFLFLSPDAWSLALEKVALLCVDSRNAIVYSWIFVLQKISRDVDSFMLHRFEGWSDLVKQTVDELKRILPERFHAVLTESVVYGLHRFMRCVDSLFVHFCKDVNFCTFKDADFEFIRFAIGIKDDCVDQYEIYHVQVVHWLLELVEQSDIFQMVPVLGGVFKGQQFVKPLTEFLSMESKSSCAVMRSILLSVMNNNVVFCNGDGVVFTSDALIGRSEIIELKCNSNGNITEVSGQMMQCFHQDSVQCQKVKEGGVVPPLRSSACLLEMIRELPQTKVRKDIHVPLSNITIGDDMKTLWRTFERTTYNYHVVLGNVLEWLFQRCVRGCHFESGETLSVKINFESEWEFVANTDNCFTDPLYQFFSSHMDLVRFLRSLDPEDAMQRVKTVATERGKKRIASIAQPGVKKARIVKQIESSSTFVETSKVTKFKTCERIRSNYITSDGNCKQCKKTTTVFTKADHSLCHLCFSKFWCLLLLKELKRTNISLGSHAEMPCEFLFNLDKSGNTTWENRFKHEILTRDALTIVDVISYAISHKMRKMENYSVAKLWSDVRVFNHVDLLNAIRLFEINVDSMFRRLYS